MTMDINDLRLFLEVAELGSFTRAAAQRNTVQSHISRQITDLEKQCGSALFRRTGRGVVLTEFGTHVQQRVRGWLKDSDELFADIQQTSQVPMGEVKIGVLPSAAHPLMTHVFKRLHHDYPKIKLNIREGQGSELDALLDTGAVDMAILFRYEKPNGNEETLLSTANTYLVSSPGLSLTHSETVDFKRLEGLPLVLPRRPSHWRSILDETAKSKGFGLTCEVEADSLRVQKEIIAANPHMYALLGPFTVHEELRMGKLQAAKVMAPDLKRYVTLANSKQGHFTQASRIVARLIVQTVAQWQGQISQPLRGV
jgi:LysR family transcriptional regulator, nitrogen assimilation regulatory protein